MVVEAREIVPGDGDVVEGVASVDESAITGESAPVIRESGGDRSAVTGGTKVLSDRIVVRITQRPGASFIDRMIALVEGASRRRTPNEIALNILPAALTIVFLLAVAALQPMAIYSHGGAGTAALDADGVSGIVPVSLLVCLIPTTIGALLSAIGIAGTDRLVRRNVLAMSGRAVEAAGDVGTLLLDKTGTVTLGDRRASAFVPVGGVPERALADAAHLSSVADETPEGRSIVVFAEEHHGVRGRAGGESGPPTGCRSARGPACRASTWTAGRCARARSGRSPTGSASTAGPSRPSWRRCAASSRPTRPRHLITEPGMGYRFEP